MTTALIRSHMESLPAILLAAVLAESGLAQSPCDADLDHDGIVAGADLALVLGDWGPCKGCQGDVTNNGLVDGIDLAFVLTLWGGACSTVPWGTVLEQQPDPAVVYDANLRTRIMATGLPWRVRDDGTGIEMLLVPPGTFDMGCIQGSNNFGCYPFEQPVHTVTLTNAYYIGRYEVTQAQWQAKMGSNPSYFQGQADSPSLSVEQVSWNTIQGFLTATGLRLPTEAEWEYACRAGTTTPIHSGPGFPNGTTDDNLVPQVAWYYYNTCSGGDGCRTHAVGTKAANALGLHDMLGNVWEWCNDWYGDYSTAAQTNPTGPPSGSSRVVRGGSWNFDASSVRSSSRYYFTPSGPYYYVGFRVARNP